MSLLVASLIYLNLLLILAVVSASETAIHSARDVEAQLLAAGEGAVAKKLRAITANPFAQLHRALLLSAALNLALAALGPPRAFRVLVHALGKLLSRGQRDECRAALAWR